MSVPGRFRVPITQIPHQLPPRLLSSDEKSRELRLQFASRLTTGSCRRWHQQVPVVVAEGASAIVAGSAVTCPTSGATTGDEEGVVGCQRGRRRRRWCSVHARHGALQRVPAHADPLEEAHVAHPPRQPAPRWQQLRRWVDIVCQYAFRLISVWCLILVCTYGMQQMNSPMLCKNLKWSIFKARTRSLNMQYR